MKKMALLNAAGLFLSGDKEAASAALNQYITKRAANLIKEGRYRGSDDDSGYDPSDYEFTDKEKAEFSEQFNSHGMTIAMKGYVDRPASSHTQHYGHWSPPETTTRYGKFDTIRGLNLTVNGILAIEDGFEPGEKEIFAPNFGEEVMLQLEYMYEYNDDPEFLAKVLDPIRKNPAVLQDIVAAFKRICEEYGEGTSN